MDYSTNPCKKTYEVDNIIIYFIDEEILELAQTIIQLEFKFRERESGV